MREQRCYDDSISQYVKLLWGEVSNRINDEESNESELIDIYVSDDIDSRYSESDDMVLFEYCGISEIKY